MDYYTQLSEYVKSNDNASANRVVMIELGRSLVDNRENFLDIFDNAGIEIDPKSSNADLINKFVENAPKNRKLLLGAAYLINHKYRKVGFDGQEEIDNTGVKATYKVMDDYFNASGPVAVPTGFGSAVATAVGQGANLANTLATNKARKKYGVETALDKSSQANQNLIQGATSQIQAKLDKRAEDKKEQEKFLKIALWVGGGLAVLGGGLLLYKLSK